MRNGCDAGYVEVHLRGPNGAEVVRRDMNASDNSSTWRINGRPSTEKAVLEHVRALNIQVDNLMCVIGPFAAPLFFLTFSPLFRLFFPANFSRKSAWATFPN